MLACKHATHSIIVRRSETKTGLRGARGAAELTNQELRFVLLSELRTTRLDVLFEVRNSFMFVL